MAQFTVSIDPTVKRADSTCEIRVRTSRGTYKTFVIRDGESIRTDDPVVAANLACLLGGREAVVKSLAVRPANPTHDLDNKPDDATAEAKTR